MARGGALRGAFSAWLGLIVLYTVGQSGSTNRIVELLGDVNRLVERALDPDVPAIPNLRGGQQWGGGGNATAQAGFDARYPNFRQAVESGGATGTRPPLSTRLPN